MSIFRRKKRPPTIFVDFKDVSLHRLPVESCANCAKPFAITVRYGGAPLPVAEMQRRLGWSLS